jgi:hypothetical protein
MSDKLRRAESDSRSFSNNLRKSAGAKAAFTLAAFMMTASAPAQLFAAGNDNYRDIDTKYSRHTQALVKEFNDNAKDVRIAVMDRDWFQANLALQQARGSKDRARVASDYINDRTGVRISDYALFRYGISQDLEDGQGYAVPAGVGPTAGMDPGVCIVFGQFADLDAASHVRFLTGLGSGLYTELDKNKLKNVMPLEKFTRHVDYHEIGHCLYESRVKTVDRTMADVVIHRHKSEMYADIMGVLLSAHYDGETDMGKSMADLRMVSAALNGPIATHYAEGGSFDYFSATMYTIHDGSLGAQRAIDRLGVKAIKAMSLDELRTLGDKILEENALDVKKMDLVTIMFANQYDMEPVEQFVKQHPGYDDAFIYVTALKMEMSDAIGRVVDLKGLDKHKNVLDQLAFDFDGWAQRMKAQSHAQQAPGVPDKMIVDFLKERLIQSAGGDKATVNGLVKAFVEIKDLQRQQLAKGNEAQRATVMKWLPLMGDALMEAVKEVQGRAPQPAPGPAPAP